jgi:mono/diheme cytochrome c family protein
MRREVVQSREAAQKERTMRALLALALSLWALGVNSHANAEEARLTVSAGGEPRSFTAAELLARPDASTIEIAHDVSYERPMAYRAVPLLALLGQVGARFDTIEARAADGFVSQIPLALIEKGADGGSEAWIAIDDSKAPWPALPGKDAGAGPFYLVWQHAERSGVGSEQWPYQLAALTATESPAHRWPQIAVGHDVAADAPERLGQKVFVTQCMPCHRMKGAGAADIGPDLGQPMGPTQYLSNEGLRKLIRDPKSVRTWPEQRMPAFGADKLSETELDAVIAYLAHMAPRSAQ